MNHDNLAAIDPETISSDQEKWNTTAEGILKRLLWQIETGQVKPKEMVIAFMDRKGGNSVVCIEKTLDSPLKTIGLLSAALHLGNDSILYGDRS